MIYLDMYVTDEEKTVDFYVNKLGLFEHQGGGRLICTQHDYLIIDLRKSDKNIQLDFCISFEKGLSIIKHLEENNISYELVHNLAGSWLYLKDINQNNIALKTGHYEMD